ncbi:hypothetical protein AB1Y20_013853 [Prymnesium parvum]|uniref:Nucleoside-diphosphate kinase n=1 Tax=Prymnesium parvum TaxID=97485 RepID=A0AB34IGK2_PRYPA
MATYDISPLDRRDISTGAMLGRLASRLAARRGALAASAALGGASLAYLAPSAPSCDASPVYVEMRSSVFVINGFYMAMREKYTAPSASIRYFLVEWEPEKLSWADFREKVLGATDPATAADGSLRKQIFSSWKSLGLAAEPNVGDNGVHASASPFEALAERLNWVGAKLEDDPFGKAMLAAGIPKATILEWTKDPQVTYEGKKGSLFDLLEDLDYDECLKKAQAIAGVSGPRPAGKMQAFVFIKPHAVTPAAEALAKSSFAKAGISVYKEGVLKGREIEEKKLIDNHYYAIANKASLSKPSELNPSEKAQAAFEKQFGISWKQALANGIVYNAIDGCKRLGITGDEMDKVWATAKKTGNLVKFGGGFYAGKIPAPMKAEPRLKRQRTSGDMAVFTSGERAIDSVLSQEGGKML